jgi:hypothetical protein
VTGELAGRRQKYGRRAGRGETRTHFHPCCRVMVGLAVVSSVATVPVAGGV